ncbi:MAG: hypothetical protein PWQ29_1064 [Verrucomicrobiota bacterium]|jgi:tetratricopeptide (TPR) repeat protein|nr:hypothetical protein [Verrucomicrobiota bacterium]MDK2963670.1 hypothetical protein [Verrucomicrobiota bacterium]
MRTSHNIKAAAVMLIGILFWLSGCATPAESQLSANAQAEALSHFSMGLLAEANGDSSGALEHLEKAIQLDPSEEKLSATAITIALRLKQNEKAARLAESFSKAAPGTEAALLFPAKVYALTNAPERAEPLFKQAVAEFPNSAESASALAQFYLSQKQREKAIETLRTAIENQPENALLLQLLGALYVDSARDLGDSPQAVTLVEKGIDCLRKSLAIEPENPAGLQQLGYALLAIKKTDEALDVFRKVRTYAPEELLPAQQFLNLLLQTDRVEEALSIYPRLAADTGTEPEIWIQYLAEQIPAEKRYLLTDHLEKLLLEPDPAVFYYAQLGSLYVEEGTPEKAEAVLRKALVSHPGDSRLYIVLGHLHLLEGRYEEAYQDLKRVRTGSPENEWWKNPFVMFNSLVSAQKSGHLDEAASLLADSYDKNREILSQYIHILLTGKTPASNEDAIELLNAFVSRRPETAEAFYYLIMLQADQHQYTDALQAARQFEKLAVDSGNTNLLNGQFYYQYASIYERTGQLEEAEKQFQKAIKLGDAEITAAAQNYIAYMWAERGEKLDAGLDLIQKALSFDPDNPAFLDTLGWIYYKQGRYDEALRELQKALSFSPQENPEILEHLGEVYFKLGNREAAIEQWQKALELKPDSPSVIERLKQNGITPAGCPGSADGPAATTPRP